MAEMIGFLEGVTYWYWFAFGVLLMLVEILVPGFVFIWLGVAGIAMGFVLLAFPALGWEYQLVAYGVLSIISIAAGRPFFSARVAPSDHPSLNRRGDAFIGQQFTLGDATASGHGRLQIGDTMWAIRIAPPGQDIAAGEKVTVVGVDGATLIVEAFVSV